ncbi:hypothetical protein BC829DRAFT_247794 [Chytridium lagenaria]|nr:hypothetical protein BC829DRAFT_247794 [Chytridium lagenaria]
MNSRKAAIDNMHNTFPTVVIVFLSESIIKDLCDSKEKVWAAINAWDYMMRLADASPLTVLPIFIASRGEGGGIIGSMFTKLRHALYLVSSTNSETRNDTQCLDRTLNNEAGTTEDAETSFARAFDTINRLFKLQGVVIENLQQAKVVVDKIVETCRLRIRSEVGATSPHVKLLKNTVNESFVASGFHTGHFNIVFPITSDNIDMVQGFLPLPYFKEFEGILGFEKGLTTLMETFSMCSSLESINLDAAMDRDSNERTDDGLAILSKYLKNSRLISLTLHMNMISGKAAPGLANAISRHPTLKELHLNGFAFHFTRDIATKLTTNKVLTKLTLRGGRIKERGILTSSPLPDDAMKSLCNLLLSNDTLTHLNLQGNILRTKDIEQLGAALARNNTLTFWIFHIAHYSIKRSRF